MVRLLLFVQRDVLSTLAYQGQTHCGDHILDLALRQVVLAKARGLAGRDDPIGEVQCSGHVGVEVVCAAHDRQLDDRGPTCGVDHARHAVGMRTYNNAGRLEDVLDFLQAERRGEGVEDNHLAELAEGLMELGLSGNRHLHLELGHGLDDDDFVPLLCREVTLRHQKPPRLADSPLADELVFLERCGSVGILVECELDQVHLVHEHRCDHWVEVVDVVSEAKEAERLQHEGRAGCGHYDVLLLECLPLLEQLQLRQLAEEHRRDVREATARANEYSLLDTGNDLRQAVGLIQARGITEEQAALEHVQA
mmetsp:Transcript_18504/g.71453  ORF Transcript_18504/g.71453 Transcript_18504/m.71453 type:complete len:308 (+) Transcript_18504:48-971(+)